MTIIEAIFLGIIQGLTEFLPISSTGHLTVAGKLMGLISDKNPESWTAFIAVIQMGTLGAVLVYFRKDIYNIVTNFFTENIRTKFLYREQNTDARLGWLIIIGSIPVVIIGLGFKDVIEGVLTKDLRVIAASLIGLALLLGLAEKTARFRKELKDITVLDSLLIGFAQSLALIPGSSRSGTTITGGLFVGLNRETAARFSFLLSIPAVFGSGLLQFYQEAGNLNESGLLTLAVATIVSGISGYAAIDFLLKFLRRHTTFLFVYYRIALGILIFLLLELHFITN